MYQHTAIFLLIAAHIHHVQYGEQNSNRFQGIVKSEFCYQIARQNIFV